MGIVLGAGGAVVIRVICTFLVAQLLNMSFVKLVGGAVIIWIAVKLLTEGAKEECHDKQCDSVWQALWIIIVADMSMGIDNMLAVGAASHGNLFLLLFGLILSIPIVVFMSTWLSKLMDRYPIILWIGAAVLGKVGGEMMITDPWVSQALGLPGWVEYAVHGDLRRAGLPVQQVADRQPQGGARGAGRRREAGRLSAGSRLTRLNGCERPRTVSRTPHHGLRSVDPIRVSGPSRREGNRPCGLRLPPALYSGISPTAPALSWRQGLSSTPMRLHLVLKFIGWCAAGLPRLLRRDVPVPAPVHLPAAPGSRPADAEPGVPGH